MTGFAFFKQALTVIENALSGVAPRTEPVTVLWVQNVRVDDSALSSSWQDLSDATSSHAVAT
ncbi:MAG: hypothetical protein AAF458_13865 [Pseudomonadota bacterium]